MKINKITKVLVLLLCTIMIISVFSGCSANKTGTGGGNKNDNTLTGQSVEPMHTLRLLSPDTSDLNFKIANREKYHVWQVLEETLASRGLELKVELIPFDQYPVVCQTRLASATDLPDMINISVLNDETLVNLIGQKVLLPLDEIIDNLGDGTARKFFADTGLFSRKLATFEDGKMYWFNNISSVNYEGRSVGAPFAVSIRKDWITKLGMSLPTTLDEFTAVVKAFRTKDANGNKINDEVLGINEGFNNGIASWFGLGTELFYVDTESQKVKTPWQEPSIKDYINYMKMLVDEEVLDLTTADQFQQKLAENAISGLYTYAILTSYEPSTGDADAYYEPVGPFEAVKGVKALMPAQSPNLASRGFAVTNACKDTKAVAILLDYVCSEDYYILTEWGIEGETYKMADGKRTFMEGIGYSFIEQMAENYNTTGYYLWGNKLLPRMEITTYTYETYHGPFPESKANYHINGYSYPYKTLAFANDTTYFSLSTKEEVQLQAELLTDIATYSSELLLKLILGQKSMDDWDTYMKELEELGLSKLLQVYQNRYNRYLKS